MKRLLLFLVANILSIGTYCSHIKEKISSYDFFCILECYRIEGALLAAQKKQINELTTFEREVITNFALSKNKQGEVLTFLEKALLEEYHRECLDKK